MIIKRYLYASSGRFIERKKQKRKKLRRKDYQPQEAGDLVQVDSITIFLNGIKRYMITGIDLSTRFTFSYTYKSLSSLQGKDFMEKFRYVAPFSVKHIHDPDKSGCPNGGEFEKYFEQHIKNNNRAHKIFDFRSHFYNYPRHPKSNAYDPTF